MHELDPKRDTGKGKLLTHKLRGDLHKWLAKKDGLAAEFAIAELDEIAELSDKINELQRRITTHVEAIAPSLLALPGCGALSAAKIIGESADITRFPTESAFARFAGVGPIPMWSGGTEGEMRNRKSGNRQVNAALHRITLTQTRVDGAGANYYRKRIDDGDTPAMARRCLKRHIARVVYRRMQHDHKHAMTGAPSDSSTCKPGGTFTLRATS
jgi:transposase